MSLLNTSWKQKVILTKNHNSTEIIKIIQLPFEFVLDWNHVIFLLFYLLVSIHHTMILSSLHYVFLVLHFLLKQLLIVPKNNLKILLNVY